MQISAKATFLGFAQALDPQTGALDIAGIRIALAHTAGAKAGDVLQVDAVLDHEGVWSGVVTARLAQPEIGRLGVPAMSKIEPAAPPPTPALRAAQAKPAPTGEQRAVEASSMPPAPAAPAQARTPARRFGVSSAAPREAAPAPARPRFTPSAADAKVSY